MEPTLPGSLVPRAKMMVYSLQGPLRPFWVLPLKEFWRAWMGDAMTWDERARRMVVGRSILRWGKMDGSQAGGRKESTV